MLPPWEQSNHTSKHTRQKEANGLAKYKHLTKELNRDLRFHQARLLLSEEFVFWGQLWISWWSKAAAMRAQLKWDARRLWGMGSCVISCTTGEATSHSVKVSFVWKKIQILLVDPGATICMEEGVLWFCYVELQWGTCLNGKRRWTVPAPFVACSRGFFQKKSCCLNVCVAGSHQHRKTSLLL